MEASLAGGRLGRNDENTLLLPAQVQYYGTQAKLRAYNAAIMPTSFKVGLVFGLAIAGLLVALSFANLSGIPMVGSMIDGNPLRYLGATIGSTTLVTAIGGLIWYSKKSKRILNAIKQCPTSLTYEGQGTSHIYRENGTDPTISSVLPTFSANFHNDEDVVCKQFEQVGQIVLPHGYLVHKTLDGVGAYIPPNKQQSTECAMLFMKIPDTLQNKGCITMDFTGALEAPTRETTQKMWERPWARVRTGTQKLLNFPKSQTYEYRSNSYQRPFLHGTIHNPGTNSVHVMDVLLEPPGQEGTYKLYRIVLLSNATDNATDDECQRVVDAVEGRSTWEELKNPVSPTPTPPPPNSVALKHVLDTLDVPAPNG